MTLFQNKYRAESHRLKNWDYSQEAIYFLTVCCVERACFFGEIKDGKMYLNEAGKIVEQELLHSEQIRTNWIFYTWVIMPNHIHILVEIVHKDDVETYCSASLSLSSQNSNENSKKILARPAKSISSFIAIFKSITTKRINEQRGGYAETIWQPNYHDHIVRDEKSFDYIYNYILNNPLNWEKDGLFSL